MRFGGFRDFRTPATGAFARRPSGACCSAFWPRARGVVEPGLWGRRKNERPPRCPLPDERQTADSAKTKIFTQKRGSGHCPRKACVSPTFTTKSQSQSGASVFKSLVFPRRGEAKRGASPSPCLAFPAPKTTESENPFFGLFFLDPRHRR